MTLFHSLKTLSLDGAVNLWPRVNILLKKLQIVKKSAAECFFWQNKGFVVFCYSKWGQILKINYLWQLKKEVTPRPLVAGALIEGVRYFIHVSWPCSINEFIFKDHMCVFKISITIDIQRKGIWNTWLSFKYCSCKYTTIMAPFNGRKEASNSWLLFSFKNWSKMVADIQQLTYFHNQNL